MAAAIGPDGVVCGPAGLALLLKKQTLVGCEFGAYGRQAASARMIGWGRSRAAEHAVLRFPEISGCHDTDYKAWGVPFTPGQANSPTITPPGVRQACQ